ncbi:MAG: twin-arginine translocase TatA/TatE family subunit [bacterium]
MRIGLGEIIIIILIIVLIFGVGFLTRFFGAVGKGVREFKKGLTEDNKNTEDSDKK